MKVAVSIHASEDFSVEVLKNLKGLDLIHLDVMDNKFVPNLKLNLSILKTIKENSELPIEVHLMVENPLNYIDKVVDYIDIFLFHIEIKEDISTIIKKVKKLSKKIGLVINPDTQIKELEPYLPFIDVVLVMGVHPGFSGQKFIESTKDRVEEIRKYKNQSSFEISVDGGVNLETSKKLNGADILISASAILNAEDPNYVIRELRNR